MKVKTFYVSEDMVRKKDRNPKNEKQIICK